MKTCKKILSLALAAVIAAAIPGLVSAMPTTVSTTMFDCSVVYTAKLADNGIRGLTSLGVTKKLGFIPDSSMGDLEARIYNTNGVLLSSNTNPTVTDYNNGFAMTCLTGSTLWTIYRVKGTYDFLTEHWTYSYYPSLP